MHDCFLGVKTCTRALVILETDCHVYCLVNDLLKYCAIFSSLRMIAQAMQASADVRDHCSYHCGVFCNLAHISGQSAP